MSVSAIYEGAVRHRRFAERRHEFSYRLAMFYLDLDELPTLLDGAFVSSGRRLVRFRRADYFGDPGVSLAESVRERVAERTGKRPAGPIRLLTQLRSFGHCFNPVSFYYCLDERDSQLEAVLADVTNTPWGERHGYVLAAERNVPAVERNVLAVERNVPAAEHAGGALRGEGAKRLHVSPFMGMDHDYEWRLTPPSETLEVDIASSRRGELAFDATLRMRRRALTRRTLSRMTARYPASTVRTLALIYSQALRLRAKGVRVQPHPASTGR